MFYFISLTDHLHTFSTEFSAELEANINTLLCSVQTLVKKRERVQQREQHGDTKRGQKVAFKPAVVT